MNLNAIKAARLYRHWTYQQLMNGILCNRLMKRQLLVRNASSIYRLACRFLGEATTHKVMELTFCRLFLAGHSLPAALETCETFRSQRVSVILDFCAEGVPGNDVGKLDANARSFAETARQMKDDEMIALKISGLLPLTLLRKLSGLVQQRDQRWASGHCDGAMDGPTLQRVFAIPDVAAPTQLSRYLRVVFGFEGNPSDFRVDELLFKASHHSWHLFDPARSELCSSALTPDEVQQLRDFEGRLASICDPVASKPDSRLSVLVDAEQSYLQPAIESFSEQLQRRYNRQRLLIVPTIQSYLKRSQQRVDYEIRLAEAFGLHLGAKLVRGAYLNEETRLAEAERRDSPVVSTFDETTTNYLANLEALLKKQAKVVVASHNADTLEKAVELASKYCPQTADGEGEGAEVRFAQLMGLGDHLTYGLRERGFKVYKYLPWAGIDTAIPYIIRRAEELNQMKYPLDIQNALYLHELVQKSSRV